MYLINFYMDNLKSLIFLLGAGFLDVNCSLGFLCTKKKRTSFLLLFYVMTSKCKTQMYLHHRSGTFYLCLPD